jgi:Ser/Thr protein kinase RdoA (MazF antagonist)
MGWRSIAELKDIALKFELGSEFDAVERYGGGHINDTYVVNASQGPGEVRFILQRINKSVFKDPAALMDNIRRVTEHLQNKRTAGHTSLSLVPARAGGHLHVDESSEYWRMYRFLEGARSYDSIPSVAHAREAAAEFGRFQELLRDLPGPRLAETIPGFHNTPARYVQFHQALDSDTHDRRRHCMPEIDRALVWEECAASLLALQEAGDIAERITHNDTKINNVMFDLDSDKAVCVIDLDTVMPGLALNDFGDLVRTATTPAAEDETDLSRITMRMDYYEALVDGYLGAAGRCLNEVEVENLAVAGRIITIETGVRFLSDYLSGDEYFRVQRPNHNLDRCRAQFAMAASIDEQLGDMQQLATAVFRSRH